MSQVSATTIHMHGATTDMSRSEMGILLQTYDRGVNTLDSSSSAATDDVDRGPVMVGETCADACAESFE